jgi:hypothetical protein
MKTAAALMMGAVLFALAATSAQSQNRPTSSAPQSATDAAAPGTTNMPRSAVAPTAPPVEGRVSEDTQSAPAISTDTANKGAKAVPPR